MDEKEKVEDCYCKLYCGMIEKDGLLLSEVLDNSFVLIHMTGIVAVFGGGQYTWRLQLNVELVRDVGTWRITEMRASTC